jgi:hypothetical protein
MNKGIKGIYWEPFDSYEEFRASLQEQVKDEGR